MELHVNKEHNIVKESNNCYNGFIELERSNHSQLFCLFIFVFILLFLGTGELLITLTKGKIHDIYKKNEIAKIFSKCFWNTTVELLLRSVKILLRTNNKQWLFVITMIVYLKYRTNSLKYYEL